MALTILGQKSLIEISSTPRSCNYSRSLGLSNFLDLDNVLLPQLRAGTILISYLPLSDVLEKRNHLFHFSTLPPFATQVFTVPGSRCDRRIDSEFHYTRAQTDDITYIFAAYVGTM